MSSSAGPLWISVVQVRVECQLAISVVLVAYLLVTLVRVLVVSLLVI